MYLAVWARPLQLAKMIGELKGRVEVDLVAGDIQTDIKERIRAAEAPIIQIDTEGACHLLLPRISEAPKTLGVDDPDLTLNKERRQLALYVRFFL